ncbi:MFS transporter [Rhodococcoides fascians]|uniref:MFS transporter n=1 Tax=Rhodococcoides fascians TaxID=1828 RepID=UPI001C912610|nr:MFS transporter [Rhodococcus fascians]
MFSHNNSSHSSRRGRRGDERRHGVGFWIVAVAFLTAMAFSTAPSPLYPLYQQHNQLSTFTITVVFAIYALGVVLSLMLVGHMSDVLGRKKVLIPALLLELGAAVLFVTSSSLAVLLVARFVTGLGVGILTATATAYLYELHARHRPHQPSHRFDSVSTLANIGGLGVGPLIVGTLSEWTETPLHAPFVVFAIALVAVTVAVIIVPETTVVPSRRVTYRPQRISVELDDRPRYISAATTGFASFAVIGLFSSVATGFVAGTLDHPSRILSGSMLFVVFGAAALSGTATRRLSNHTKARLGMSAMLAGMVAIMAGSAGEELVVFVLGGVSAGAGAGILFKHAVVTVAAMATPAARSEALAGLFLVSYLGLSLPVLSVGLATQFVTLSTAIAVLVAVILVLLSTVAWCTREQFIARAV